MGFSNFWFLDLYLFMGAMMLGFALFFLLIMLIIVAVEGRQAWEEKWTALLVMFGGMAVLWPVLLIGAPLYGIYRLVTGK